MLDIQGFILGNSALLMHQTGEEKETITGTTALGFFITQSSSMGKEQAQWLSPASSHLLLEKQPGSSGNTSKP